MIEESKEVVKTNPDSTLKPIPNPGIGPSTSEKIAIIESCFEEILTTLGMDLNDESLKKTPHRIAKMYVLELFKSLNAEASPPKMTTIPNDMGYDQMVVVQDIHVMSVCEHHFQPIYGVATVAYIPRKKVVGLSKINRVVDYFVRRPQVQERLTKQIADFLAQELETPDVAVHIQARHFCVIARGVEDTHSSTSSSDLRGSFKDRSDTRREFLQNIRPLKRG